MACSQRSLCPWLLVVLCLLPALAICQDVESKPEIEAGSGIYVFTPPPMDERPDIFGSLVARLEREAELARLLKDRRPDDSIVEESTAMDVDRIQQLAHEMKERAEQEDQAEIFARRAVSEIQAHNLNQNWDAAITTADRRLRDLATWREVFPENRVLDNANRLIQGYRTQADEKKTYEEARAQFAALDLRVVGILWSADQPSLAIIEGEPVARGVNERVRDTTIVGIDTNRVDFMHTYRTRNYHFQLYLEQ